MNIYDVLIAVAVAIVLFFAVKGTVKNKNKGCGGDCSNCPGCHR
ncbi:MAG: FeoB-associated Cys-rich membrane protein [Oscillospiraceae bacterium]|nr:FeoB-associated Cys-rich membrane protein [Oscillospiraceae bacterium]